MGNDITPIWPADRCDLLRTLWAEGHVTAEIGRRLGCTKNAVIGKAGRMELPPRENPVIRQGCGPSMSPSAIRSREERAGIKRVVRDCKVTLPPLAASVMSAVIAVEKRSNVAVPVRRLASVTGSVRTCQWLEGQRRAYVTCDVPALPGKSYCGTHCARAYRAPGPAQHDAHG